jgi:hypothetical protein
MKQPILGVKNKYRYVFYISILTLEVPTIRKDFLNFDAVSDLNGSGLASVILENLNKHNIDLEKVVGQRYDGAAIMSGHLHNVQAIIRRTFPRALFVHCSAHSLNLAISDACKIIAIRNCVGCVSSVCNFFGAQFSELKFKKKLYKHKLLFR